MRISYWSSDVCSSDLRAPIELLDRAIRLTPAARIPPTGVLGRGSERATVGVGRRQDLVCRILIGLCLPVRLARHLTPFGDRTRGHRWREAEPRDLRGCIVDLLPIAEARHHRPIVLPPSKARASAHISKNEIV